MRKKKNKGPEREMKAYYCKVILVLFMKWHNVI